MVVSQRNGISLGTFTRDPTAFMNARPFVGALSNLGVLGWCAAATVCLLAWLVRRHRQTGRVSAAFFLSAGLLMIVVGWLAYFGRVAYRELIGH